MRFLIMLLVFKYCLDIALDGRAVKEWILLRDILLPDLPKFVLVVPMVNYPQSRILSLILLHLLHLILVPPL